MQNILPDSIKKDKIKNKRQKNLPTLVYRPLFWSSKSSRKTLGLTCSNSIALLILCDWLISESSTSIDYFFDAVFTMAWEKPYPGNYDLSLWKRYFAGHNLFSTYLVENIK